MKRQYLIKESELQQILQHIEDVEQMIYSIESDEKIIPLIHRQSKDNIFNLSSGLIRSKEKLKQIKEILK